MHELIKCKSNSNNEKFVEQQYLAPKNVFAFCN